MHRKSIRRQGPAGVAFMNALNIANRGVSFLNIVAELGAVYSGPAR